MKHFKSPNMTFGWLHTLIGVKNIDGCDQLVKYVQEIAQVLRQLELEMIARKELKKHFDNRYHKSTSVF